MTTYEIIGAIGICLIVAMIGYLMWELTREVRH